ncbi:hypothetical protein [Halobacteriovorax sp. HLS]|uniref:hypothetical protein n=1 Tax=Halobacteriovorax sp. HLS TaxID=2234000 RepID=UPI000FD8BF34|nr:hypothetical protein [Halobacteriovorax sp. HLS]
MNLLLPERMILESVSRKNMTLDAIKRDTGLSDILVNSLIPELIYKNMLLYKNNKYFINTDPSSDWLEKVNGLESREQELRDLLNASVENQAKDKEFKLKKVFLTSYEEKLLKIELSKIDNFITQIQEMREFDNNDRKTSEMKVVYWGSANYGELVEQDLKYI